MSFKQNLQRSTEQLESIACKLDQLSAAFVMVGNNHVAAQLSKFADVVLMCSESLNDSYRTEINEQFQQSQKEIGQLLSTITNMS